MSLSDWAKNDWLKAHKTTKQEIAGLFSIVVCGLTPTGPAFSDCDGVRVQGQIMLKSYPYGGSLNGRSQGIRLPVHSMHRM
jgi:hypothetical protein